MKRLAQVLTALMLVISIGLASASSNDKGKVIPFAQLPAKAQQFFNAHFAQADMASAVLFSEYYVKKEYTIYMKDGSKVEFDSSGEWEKVKMRTTAVPAKIIPARMSQYVATSFPDTYVKEIKKSRNKYELEISNGLELEFNHKGDFLRIDD